MHETGVAISIYKSAMETMRQHAGTNLECVKVAVGELSAVEPDLLAYAWDGVMQVEELQAKLEIEWCPARQFCPSCQASKPRAEGSWFRVCPDCGDVLQVEGGDELHLLQVTFDSAEGAT